MKQIVETNMKKIMIHPVSINICISKNTNNWESGISRGIIGQFEYAIKYVTLVSYGYAKVRVRFLCGIRMR